MSKLFYRIGLSIYTLFIHFAALFNKKAKLWVVGRKSIFERLEKALKDNKKPIIWLHAASLGEFEQGRPILETIRQKHPQYNILLTFFSPSGYEIRKNYAQADWVFYLPADSPKHAARFLGIVQPKLVIFVKYEFWYYYLNALKNKGIPTYLVSAIFRPNQIFFKWYGAFFRTMLFCFDHIFVQDNNSATLLATANYHQVIIAGDTRLDRVLEIKSQAKIFATLEHFCHDTKVIVAGSTWPPDEQILQQFIVTNKHYKIVLAPHEIDEMHLLQIQKIFGEQSLRYSQQASPTQLQHARVLIIDNIGMLSSLYRYADIAYIGGGFGAGIHNTLEAVVYEIPVLFGHHYSKFKEANDLIALGIAFEIKDEKDIEKLAQQMQSLDDAHQIATKVQDYLKENSGATAIIMKHLAL